MSIELHKKEGFCELHITRRYQKDWAEKLASVPMLIHINDQCRFMVEPEDIGILKTTLASNLHTTVYLTLTIRDPLLCEILVNNKVGQFTTFNLVEPEPEHYDLVLVPVLCYRSHPMELANYREYLYLPNTQAPNWDHQLPLAELINKNPISFIDTSEGIFNRVVLFDGTELEYSDMGWDYHSDISLSPSTMARYAMVLTEEAMNTVKANYEKRFNLN